jgi:hypothetical protein
MHTFSTHLSIRRPLHHLQLFFELNKIESRIKEVIEHNARYPKALVATTVGLLVNLTYHVTDL